MNIKTVKHKMETRILVSARALRVSDYLIDLIRKDLEARDISPEV